MHEDLEYTSSRRWNYFASRATLLCQWL